jgi:hypothetical protein
MVAARRLWDREAWILLCRRALLGLLAAETSQASTLAAAAGNPHVLRQRREASRTLVLHMMGARALRLALPEALGPEWDNRPAQHGLPPCFDPTGPALEALSALRGHGWQDVPAMRALVAALAFWDGRKNFFRAAVGEKWVRENDRLEPGSPFAPVSGVELAAMAQAARCRGYEDDQIKVAPASAFAWGYSPAELEEAAPGRDLGDTAPAPRRERGEKRKKADPLVVEGRKPRAKKPAAKPPNRRTCRHKECTVAYKATGDVTCLRVDASRVKS